MPRSEHLCLGNDLCLENIALNKIGNGLHNYLKVILLLLVKAEAI
jgi:hypothetical protein